MSRAQLGEQRLLVGAGSAGTSDDRLPPGNLEYFTTAYFHLPAELGEEARSAGLVSDAVLAVEGPGWMIPDLAARWGDPHRRQPLLDLLRRIEADPAALAMSAHLLLVAHKA